jgi:peptidoglycan hydrolase-like protein with peptidoglycan-binding domain
VVLNPTAPPPTSLRTERLGDGNANCLERAVTLAKPGDQVVLFQDRRDNSGHAVVQRPDGSVVDPNRPSVTYPTMGAWQASHPSYVNPVAVPQETVKHVLSLPPGPQRDSAIQASGLGKVADRMLADGPDLSGLVGLQKGSRDAEGVEQLQRRLIEIGAVTPDERKAMEGNFGNFGDTTQRVVKRLQETHGLPVTGTIDEATAAMLSNPVDPAALVGPATQQTRDRVRQEAEQRVLSSMSPELMIHLPPEDQAAIYREAREAGDAAVAQFDRDLPILVQQEMAQRGITPESLRNLPPEDRASIMAGPTMAALGRVNLQLDALDTARAQMNPDTATLQNSNLYQTPGSDTAGENPKAWNSYCQAFASSVYGRHVPALQKGSAKDAAADAIANGIMQTDRSYQSWPAGAPVYFEATSNNGGDGHVAIFSGRFDAEGQPLMITTGWEGNPDRDGITLVPLSYLEGISGAYIGYIPYPDPLTSPYGG